MLLFSQFFGGAILNCVAKTIFINMLLVALRIYIPRIDPQQVIHAGATDILNLVEPQYVEEINSAYNRALTLTFVSGLRIPQELVLTSKVASHRSCVFGLSLELWIGLAQSFSCSTK